MHYQCETCEQIYTDRSSAADCCPNPVREIPDDQIVYCPCCKGGGCNECYNVPIMTKREFELNERFCAALLCSAPVVSAAPSATDGTA